MQCICRPIRRSRSIWRLIVAIFLYAIFQTQAYAGQPSSDPDQEALDLQRVINQPAIQWSAPDMPALEKLQRKIYVPKIAEHKSLIQQLVQWLRDWLFGKDGGQGKSNWLENIPISERIMQIILYASIAAIVGLSLAIVWRELPQFSTKRKSANSKQATSFAAAMDDEAWPPNLAGMSTRAGLSRLFASLVKRLQTQGQLPAESGLTHAELATQLSTSDVQRAAAFKQLAEQASSAVYAGYAPSSAELQNAQALAQKVGLANA
jgi:hypothetical protein